MSTTGKDRSPDPRNATTRITPYVRRIVWIACGIILGFVCGIILGMYLSCNDALQAQLADATAERAGIVEVVAALENIVVSLAVDTERSAIGIAELDERFAAFERRVSTLEKTANR